MYFDQEWYKVMDVAAHFGIPQTRLEYVIMRNKVPVSKAGKGPGRGGNGTWRIHKDTIPIIASILGVQETVEDD